MDTDFGTTGDTYNDHCGWYEDASFCTGTWDDDDFNADEMCCVCGGGAHNTVEVEVAIEEEHPTAGAEWYANCVDLDVGTTGDSYGDHCNWYMSADYCTGEWDDDDFNAD